MSVNPCLIILVCISVCKSLSVRRFRRQHEQLRGVIVRVLRPTQGKANQEEDKPQLEGGAGAQEKNLDFSDTSTVNEVRVYRTSCLSEFHISYAR